jgi:hypothetical protein
MQERADAQAAAGGNIPEIDPNHIVAVHTPSPDVTVTLLNGGDMGIPWDPKLFRVLPNNVRSTHWINLCLYSNDVRLPVLSQTANLSQAPATSSFRALVFRTFVPCFNRSSMILVVYILRDVVRGI